MWHGKGDVQPLAVGQDELQLSNPLLSGLRATGEHALNTEAGQQANAVTVLLEIAVPALIDGEQQFGGAGNIYGAEYNGELRACKPSEPRSGEARPTGVFVALLKCPPDVEHRQIKYRNNVIECGHGRLKRIISASLGFKSMKKVYATIKGIELMRALRKGQVHPQGEMRLVSSFF